jgi:F-type H+-transporting ATPase subunit c
MTKKLFAVLFLMLIVCPIVFAETAAPASTSDAHSQWVVISGTFAMAIASSICGLAQGKAIASAVEGMARNPGAAKAIQLAMLIGLAFIESLSLYTLLVVFLKVVF